MRALSKLLFVVALAACGQTASSGGSAEAANTAPAATAGGGEAAYVAACVERYVAQSPDARRWAPDQCVRDWQIVVATGPLAEAILVAAAGGAPARGSAGADVEITANGRNIEFGWGETGGLIPYDAPGALAERGATVSMVGCSQLGVGEFQKYYSVTPVGGSAFPLGIYARSAPTADASSFYTVSVERGAAVKSIAQLRGDGSEWTATCAY